MPVDGVRECDTKLLATRGPVAAVGHALRSRLLFSGTTDCPDRAAEADLNAERLWRLLMRGTMTIRELREHGVKAPAQGMYDLQLAGYVIDRLRARDEAGHQTVGYRLNTEPQTMPDRHAPQEASPQSASDQHASGRRRLSDGHPDAPLR
jgi:hypothetical protein